MATLLDWFQLISNTPRALHQRLSPDPNQTLAPKPDYEYGQLSRSSALHPWLQLQSEGSLSSPPLNSTAPFAPATQQPEPKTVPVSKKVAPRRKQAARSSLPAKPRYDPDDPVNKAYQPPPEPPLAALAQAPNIAPPVGGGPDPAVIAQLVNQPAPAAVSAEIAAEPSLRDRFNQALQQYERPADPDAALKDTLMALAIGGLGTAAAASRPGSTPFGSIAEGNMGGLQTMLQLRNMRRMEDTASGREKIGLLGTMANLENSEAAREANEAYRREMMQDRQLGRDIQMQQLAQQGGQFERTMQERARQQAEDLGLQRSKLGLEAEKLGIDKGLTQSQIEENKARAKYYTEGGRQGVGGEGGGRNDPAVVATHRYLIEQGIEPDPKKAWQMASRDYNEDKIAANVYSKFLDDPFFRDMSQEEQQRVVQGHLRTIENLRSGNTAEGSATAQQGGAVQGHYNGEQEPMPGARKDRSGFWWMPDQRSKSGWSPVIITQ